MTRKLHLVLLAAVTLLAAALRVYQSSESLWVDELHTAWVSAGDLSDVASRARIGNQSPLYFYLTWGLAGLFGEREFVLRLPSLAAGTALVPLIYLLVFALTTSRGAALLSAALTALDRDFIFYAQEARPYALVQLTAMLQVSAFWKLTATSTDAARRQDAAHSARQMAMRCGYVLLTVVLVWLHYTAALLLVGEVLYFAFLVLFRKGAPGYRWYEFAFDLFLAAAFCSPLVYPLWEVFQRRRLWGQIVTIYPTWNMVRAAGLYVALPLAVLGGTALVRLLADCRTILARVDRRAAALIIGWIWIPLVIAWLLTVSNLALLFFPRYLIASALALPAVAGLALAAIPHRATQGTYALLLISVSILTSGMWAQFRYDGRLMGDRTEDWRAAVKYIAQSDEEASPPPVVLDANLIESVLLLYSPSDELRDYLCFPLTGIYRLDGDGRRIIPAHDGLAYHDVAEPEPSEYWFVVRGTEAAADRAAGKLHRNGNNLQVGHWRHFGEKLHVARVSAGP